MVIIKLAWRNIIRNKRRYMIIVIMTSISLAGLIFIGSIVKGFHLQMVDNMVRLYTGYIQIQEKGAGQHLNLHQTVKNPKTVLSLVSQYRDIVGYSERIEVNSLVISPNDSTTGIMLVGIDPEKEASISLIKKGMKKGKYLDRKAGKNIIIGQKLAAVLKVKVGDQLVVLLNGRYGSLEADIFRVSGIFATGCIVIDTQFGFITLPEARALTGLENGVSKIALALDDYSKVDRAAAYLQGELENQGLDVLTWKQLLPDQATIEQLDEEIMLLALIILALGIVLIASNINILAVAERTREFGIMMAMGIHPRKVIRQIVCESILISLISTASGIIMGTLLVKGFQSGGIQLISRTSMLFSSTTIYPQIEWLKTIIFAAVIFIAPILASFGPAIKTSKLEPANVIRHV